MKICKDIEIVSKSLGVYVKPIDALVISDLHIGYEEYLNEQGIHIPISQYPKIKKMLEVMLNECKAETVIIVGDVKHEFGKASRQEWFETLDLLDFLQKRVEEVHIVRGNHDNFLIPILKKRKIPLHDPILQIENIVFAHGHKDINIEDLDCKYIILGHEHPAIALKTEMGSKRKYKCFLHGEFEDKEIIVLPSMHPLASGSEVNILPKNELLSPILQKVDIENFYAYAVEPEQIVLKFPKIEQLSLLQ